MNKIKKQLFSLICLTPVIFILGCGQAQSAETPAPSAAPTAIKSVVSAPTTAPSPTPSPTPAPSPVAPPNVQDIFKKLKKTNITDYIIPNTYEHEENVPSYETITGEPELTYNLPVLYQEWFTDAANSLITPEIRSVKTTITPPSWQVLSTLVYNYSNDINTLSKALIAACDYQIGVYKEPGGFRVEIAAAPRNPMDLFYMIEPTERITPLNNMLSYAYLATIFDNNMNVRDGIEERELEPFLFPIANPSEYTVGDTWYDSRDGGARRHTGTDINAPEGTDLLAVREGVILDVGSTKKSGNYIVLLGDDGIQYHYYHMVEPSELSRGDKVSRGDVVGHVGNTGNSTANHLHFTIVTQDGYYLNPYPYLKEAQRRTVEELEQN